ncbi:hypothetical protein K0U00_39805, partial [Paenibacillus sepulcri]|nr:hypothetical protein [Paenibacillus sepulcri]
MDVKKCAACGVEKPLTAYSKRSSGISRRGTCRSCMRKRQRETAHSRTGGSVEPAIEPAVTVKTTIKEQAPSVAAVKAVIWPDQPDKKKISYPAEPQMQALQLETGDGASAAEED